MNHIPFILTQVTIAFFHPNTVPEGTVLHFSLEPAFYKTHFISVIRIFT